MEKLSKFKQEQQYLQQQEASGPDLLEILSLVLKNWYWFILAVVIGFFCVRLYISHTMPVYQTSATILINESESKSVVDNAQILQGLGLPRGMQNLENQIMIIKSRTLIEKTLIDLPFEIELYFKTIINQLPIYPDTPLKIVSDKEVPLPKDTEFSIRYLGNNMFNLQSESKYFPLQKTASFGEIIKIPSGSFKIECRNEEWFKSNSDKKLYFKIHSHASLVNYFAKRIKVSLVSREGSILRIFLEGTNKAKDVDFLNRQIENFQAISLDKKNTEAERRIQFIEDQLVGISDSLSRTENRLQQFRSSNKVMDLSAQGHSIIGQVTLLENERARLNLEANYYDYLADYLEKNEAGEAPIVPITMGITDPGLTRIVGELSELQGQLSARGAGEMNPLQRNLEQRVRTTKDLLRETLNGLRRANSLARSENQDQISKANAMASALPVTERQLLGIERKFRLNDELYTFLLEIRAEQKMQKASNRADSEAVDSADAQFSIQVSPNQTMLHLVALLAGLAIPLFIIYLKFLFNKKLKFEDIRKITDLPIVGNIPHNTEKTNLVVFEYPNSIVAEAFRLLRSRMQFFTKEAKSPVILVTSAMPGDGKTFTSINLASAYSLLGKKIVLVGFDLRRPHIFDDFKLQNDKGVSTWLIGKDKLQDIIQDTSFENFSVISSGPIPPNPSELTVLDKTAELLGLLKEKFDFIILDSSPIGIVSETFHLATLSDACLMVIRPEKTLKDIFEDTLTTIDASGIKSLSIVLNDIDGKGKHYGYVGKYAYTQEQKKSKVQSRLKRSKNTLSS